ncbi:hypothetical protein PENSPDRAFT_712980 [Peniophora sp. CONT]|nr:hypothetical protein PENSPDRAFT_712980 [Peniophora sp. CONT]
MSSDSTLRGDLAVDDGSHLSMTATPSRLPFDAIRQRGDSLWALYKDGDATDQSILDEAIQATRSAVELAPEPINPALLFDFGVRLYARFKLYLAIDDLDSTVSTFRHAVELTPDDDSNRRVERLTHLGGSLLDRFNWMGGLDDLDNATVAFRSVSELLPDSDSRKASVLNNYASSLRIRFERVGVIEDLERSLTATRRALELTSVGHSTIPSMHTRLGCLLLMRLRWKGELADLEQSIVAHRRAVELTPDSHSQKSSRLGNLGVSLDESFEYTGKLDDLEQAISMFRRAAQLTPDGGHNKPKWLNNLGASLRTLFERTSQPDVIEQGLAASRRAVDLTPDTDPNKPYRLSNLGGSLLVRSHTNGSLDDIEQAISAHRRAVELTPGDRPDMPSRLSNLGISFLARFWRNGETDDLEQSIAALLCAIQLTPDDHLDMPSRYSSLGNAVLARFERNGELEDLEQSIAAHRRAVERTPDGHPTKPERCARLGDSLEARFKKVGDLEDLEQSIAAQRLSLELLPDGHPQKPSTLNNLSGSLHRRYKCTKKLEDLEQALSASHAAIQLLPDGHSWLSECLYNHGVALTELLERTPTQTTFDKAIESLEKSAKHSLGHPSVRLKSARLWAHLLLQNREFCGIHWDESLLKAHEHIITILPEIVWLGNSLNRRTDASSELGEIVNNSVAVAFAIRALPHVLRWLEAGREIIWAQVLSLRTPLDELQEQHPKLAHSLRDIHGELQLSAPTSFKPDSDTFGGVVITSNAGADRHRQLVMKYDAILKEIRNCTGLGAFLRPETSDTLSIGSLQTQLMNGAIVCINVDNARCDALVLFAPGINKMTVSHVDLPDLSLKRAIDLRRLWTAHLKNGMVRATSLISLGPEEPPLHTILESIWSWIVNPILDALDLAALTRNDLLPSVTWCLTGPLTQLPLHAAGVYSDPLGPRLYNLVVSSYTSSFSAIVRSAEGVASHQAAPRTLILTQPNTPGLQSPLPGTKAEGRDLQDFLSTSQIENQLLEHEQATVASVRSALNQYPWVHIACHGKQHLGDATQTAFSLYDGPLSLADLMGTVSKDAELAFLSACQTATGDEKNPEESMHLAAGMLAVGFKGVVATMWSIGDRDAPIVVEAYYRELLKLRGSGTLARGQTGAAYALHEAVRVLRERVGEDEFLTWAPFVHFGV